MPDPAEQPQPPAPDATKHVTLQIVLNDDGTLKLHFGAHLGEAHPQQVFNALTQLAVMSEDMCVQLATALAGALGETPPQIMARAWKVVEQAKKQRQAEKLVIATEVPKSLAGNLAHRNGSANGLRLRRD